MIKPQFTLKQFEDFVDQVAIKDAEGDGLLLAGVHFTANDLRWALWGLMSSRTEKVRTFHEKYGHAINAKMPSTPLEETDDVGWDEANRAKEAINEALDSFQYLAKEYGDALPEGLAHFRLALILEEFMELFQALIVKQDRVAVADALADLAYVVEGTAVAYGIPLEVVFNEVHRSNMSKDAMGPQTKPKKGRGYFPPNIEAILELYDA